MSKGRMVVAVKIERGVPLPTMHNRYPFHSMTPGDSFFVEVDVKRVSSAASRYKRSHPSFRYTCRKVKEDGVCGSRVWRLP